MDPKVRKWHEIMIENRCQTIPQGLSYHYNIILLYHYINIFYIKLLVKICGEKPTKFPLYLYSLFSAGGTFVQTLGLA